MTRRFVPLFAAALLAAATAAPVPGLSDIVTDPDERCRLIAMNAEGIMTARQIGVPLSDILAVVNQSADPLWRTLTLEAYSAPRYVSQTAQQRAVDDFRDGVHVLCLRGNR